VREAIYRAIEARQLSHEGAHVLFVLIHAANLDGTAWPTWPALASRSGVPLAHLDRTLAELGRLGWASIDHAQGFVRFTVHEPDAPALPPERAPSSLEVMRQGARNLMRTLFGDDNGGG
jgi:hypothetical protein